MSGESRSKLELDICEQALRFDGPDRDAYLDKACGEDRELRAAAESLLSAVTDSGSFMLADFASLARKKPGT